MDQFLELRRGQLNLLVAPRALGGRLMNTFAARLALNGAVQVLDGGNLFDVHTIAQLVRRQTPQLDNALKRIRLARAFTCYQMTALLAQQSENAAPLLILGLLDTFFDESVSLAERLRLLEQSQTHLRRLCQQSALAVSVTPPPEEGRELLARLEAAADHVWRFEPPVGVVQPHLL